MVNSKLKITYILYNIAKYWRIEPQIFGAEILVILVDHTPKKQRSSNIPALTQMKGSSKADQ